MLCERGEHPQREIFRGGAAEVTSVVTQEPVRHSLCCGAQGYGSRCPRAKAPYERALRTVAIIQNRNGNMQRNMNTN